MSLERIVLRPHIVVAPGTGEARLRHLVEVAHSECYIANSLRTEIVVEPTFEIATTYAFRDGDLAASRLDMVARIFDKPSREFVAAATADLTAAPNLAVDLGCGPGHTTKLLAAITGAGRTIGLDNSEHFLELARAGAAPGVDYLRHDLTRPGWPGADSPGRAPRPSSPTGGLFSPTCPTRRRLRLSGSASSLPAAGYCSTSSSGSGPTCRFSCTTSTS